jgi:CYTH domain-containing protein
MAKEIERKFLVRDKTWRGQDGGKLPPRISQQSQRAYRSRANHRGERVHHDQGNERRRDPVPV